MVGMAESYLLRKYERRTRVFGHTSNHRSYPFGWPEGLVFKAVPIPSLRSIPRGDRSSRIRMDESIGMPVKQPKTFLGRMPQKGKATSKVALPRVTNQFSHFIRGDIQTGNTLSRRASSFS